MAKILPAPVMDITIRLDLKEIDLSGHSGRPSRLGMAQLKKDISDAVFPDIVKVYLPRFTRKEREGVKNTACVK